MALFAKEIWDIFTTDITRKRPSKHTEQIKYN